MFLSTIINRQNCMVRKKKNHRCSQNFWIWGFQPYICTMCTARLPIWAYFGQKVPWLNGYCIFPSPSSSLSLTLLLILGLSRTCVFAVLWWRRSNKKWTQCTMRRSPLQSVNRKIYQNVYVAPHFFLAPLFQMTNIWRKYLITFTFIVYLTTWVMINHSHNKIQ